MTQFFFDAGLFAIKVLTVAVTFALTLLLTLSIATRRSGSPLPHLSLRKLNDQLRRDREALEDTLLDDAAHAALVKQRKAEEKAKHKLEKQALRAAKNSEPDPTAKPRKRVFVLDFDGDIQASELEPLRHEISAVLSVANAEDEVVLRLESGGGAVHAYGLAASQLARVRAKGVKLTVCVDKVAASGGYMMACVANHLVAAPFAVLGSIGVVAQVPNVNRLLTKHNVDVELLTAGKYKRSLTIFGRNTDEGRQKFQHDLDVTHQLFQDFVREHRPSLNVAEVATGETWYGTRALAINMVDELRTSDDYLCAACENADVVEVTYEEHQPLPQRLLKNLELAVVRGAARLLGTSVSP